jgi:isopentenyl-diphosphate Delta-isomerase
LLTDQNPISSDTFVQRKKDHIEISLKDESQTIVDQFSQLQFQHNPLPEINFSEVSLKTQVFKYPINSPLFVSSMTLGHDGSQELNQRIASACQKQGWMMGVGSQRRQLDDMSAYKECEQLRLKFPNLIIFGNIGLTQIINTPIEKIKSLCSSIGAQFLVVHTNPLQEAIQREGTPHFSGGIKALTELCAQLNLPVVLKETGCGFSKSSFMQLIDVGLSAIDVSGMGGTHWGRVEGLRQSQDDLGYKVSQTFASWGISTVDSLNNGMDCKIKMDLWASGGVRNGLQAAKLLALGAKMVGFAQPILKEAMNSEIALENKIKQLDYELSVALFCLGLTNVSQLIGRRDLLK